MSQDFFDESTEQSQVKARIVSKYFWAWARVMIPRAKRRGNSIGYMDLFAGPGRYKNGTPSTPILVLEQALGDEDMRDMLVTLFNDVNEGFSNSLSAAIREIPGIQRLRHAPVVWNEEVGEEIVRKLEQTPLVPTLFFVDPWGYKGLSIRLINSVLKDWGCDAIFFFNYTRINMGLRNKAVLTHMNALFGEERAERLRIEVEGLAAEERELVIVEAIADTIKETGGTYVVPFTFKTASGRRTSHHLIFASKNVLGYSIMKEVMAGESSSDEQGVPSLDYNPAVRKQGTLFELARPLESLGGLLLSEYAGRTMTVKEFFEDHNIGRRFIKRNYKTVLMKLESDGEVEADPAVSDRRKGIMADHVRVTFPKRG